MAEGPLAPPSVSVFPASPACESGGPRQAVIDLRKASLRLRMDRLLERLRKEPPKVPATSHAPRPPLDPVAPAPPSQPILISCPRCHGPVHTSRPQGVRERFLTLLGMRPFRCHRCYYRYARFLGMRVVLGD